MIDEQRFQALANGATPSIEDYAGFVALAEAMPPELLWHLLTTSPNMNGLLRGVVNKNLQEKIPAANVEASLDAIATAILNRTTVN